VAIFRKILQNFTQKKQQCGLTGHTFESQSGGKSHFKRDRLKKVMQKSPETDLT